MKNVNLLANWDRYYKGQTVGLPDNIADNLIRMGLAHDPNAVAPEPTLKHAVQASAKAATTKAAKKKKKAKRK